MQTIFQIQKGFENQRIRSGVLTTDHGVIQTPTVIPYAKLGTVSPLTNAELKEIGCQGLATDILPLTIQPGVEVLKASGSLANFINWPGPLISFVDEFPVMQKVKKNAAELGIRYQEPFTKANRRMNGTQAQMIQKLGRADVQMPLFQTPDYYAPVDDLQLAVQLNQTWQKQFGGEWGVVTGAGLKTLREESIHDLDQCTGYLIAGLPTELDEWQRIVTVVCDLLPADCLRMVVVDSWSKELLALALGIDVVISVAEIQGAHRGEAFTKRGIFKLGYEKFATSMENLPIHGEGSVSYALLHYLHHQQDSLGDHLLGLYNWQSTNQLVGRFRQQIESAQGDAVARIFQLAAKVAADN
ncbi:tRNA-guanine transglycosylase [Limosilactobacillus caecicola]|uniref:tRNA-guanine transglycosylase n=1 Tax=Limosilactobacillus caecicola TaxID=2941332 RepID=UPI0020426B54|nr:tRNA-guanine transglycosylase [Limosilactobacillus caecicola]